MTNLQSIRTALATAAETLQYPINAILGKVICSMMPPTYEYLYEENIFLAKTAFVGYTAAYKLALKQGIFAPHDETHQKITQTLLGVLSLTRELENQYESIQAVEYDMCWDTLVTRDFHLSRTLNTQYQGIYQLSRMTSQQLTEELLSVKEYIAELLTPAYDTSVLAGYEEL